MARLDDFDETAAGLRAWARRSAHELAAVELLIWHESWLRRPDFREACVTRQLPGLVVIDWTRAREFIDLEYKVKGEEPLPASSSQQAILDGAVAVGEDRFRIEGLLGRAHKRALAQAFAAAAGLRLEPPIPEAGHSHPGFIPGNPATCHRCALDAPDEGHPMPAGRETDAG